MTYYNSTDTCDNIKEDRNGWYADYKVKNGETLKKVNEIWMNIINLKR